MSSRRARGFVLPLVLLGLLALTAVAHGVLALARHQRLAGWAGAAAVQARLASEGAVRAGARRLEEPERKALRRGGSVHVVSLSVAPGVEAEARAEGVRPEWIWVEGYGSAVRGSVQARRTTGVLYWSLDAAARVEALVAGLEHDGVLSVGPFGSLRGSDAVGAPSDWPAEVCAPHVAVLDSVLGSSGLPPAAPLDDAPLPGSGIAADGGPLGDVPRLGLLDGRRLEAMATRRLSGGRIAPSPVDDLSGCRAEETKNWGAPADPTGPCGALHPLVVSTGPLRLDGGQGQGILVVAGDLTLTGGARFVGLVLVDGALHVGNEALLQGAARVRGRVDVDGRIEASPCAVLRSLRARPELARPVAAPGGWWMRVP